MTEVKEINVNIPKRAIVVNKYAENGGWIYFLGVVGAAIYFIQTATGFWMGVLGILKAFVWPVYLVYHVFRYFGL